MSRRLAASLMTLVLVVAMLGLGTWQMQRRAWKTGVLAAIDAAESRPGVALTPDAAEFTKIAVEGSLRPNPRALYGSRVETLGGRNEMGGGLIMVLERDGAPPVLVDRGWVPAAMLDRLPAPSGSIRVEGYVRRKEAPGWFTPAPDLAARRFYNMDPASMAGALGAAGAPVFVLVALGAPPAEGLPLPATRLPRPPNDHLSYAITWYALACVLLVIFLLWLRKTRA